MRELLQTAAQEHKNNVWAWDFIYNRDELRGRTATLKSFQSRMRDELLSVESFANLREAQALTAGWQREYNTERRHSSLGYLTPVEFATRLADLPVGATPLPSGQLPLEKELTLIGVGA